ncbi:MAG: 23S rRNA (adenine(2503)-C(2))-methyltransferase RlmN [Planctomycetes bacterium]|nr:23S rRNA (adenine(2503)-C(2))-methyltransferase RlmN [Planctomycetota bacterium]
MPSSPESNPVLGSKRELRSADGVRKWAFRLADDEEIETVLIPGARRSTLCVSSQVGCAVGCTFCATARMGIRRNLTPAEIVAQYTTAQALREADPRGAPHPIENLVFMGMGEPFLAFDEVCAAIETLRADHGFHSKIITVSTIGIPNRIVEFGGRFPHVRLAVSLHSPFDEERDRLVPINRRHPLSAILEACHEYQSLYQRRIFFEYVLIAGENDGPRHARALAQLLAGLDGTVNLIPLHPGGGVDGDRPTASACDAFRAALKESFAGHVTFRRSRGLDIAAACGQLVA